MAIGQKVIADFMKDFQSKFATIFTHHKLEFDLTRVEKVPSNQNPNQKVMTDFFKSAKDGDQTGLVPASFGDNAKITKNLEQVKKKLEQEKAKEIERQKFFKDNGIPDPNPPISQVPHSYLVRFIPQCEDFMNFLSLIFYVKSIILGILEHICNFWRRKFTQKLQNWPF